MYQRIRKYINESIKKGEEITPFLCISPHLELLHTSLITELKTVLQEHNSDIFDISILRNDDPESHKIKNVKEYIARWDQSPRWKFHIFLLEDISRLTHESQNACLKFFEEPGKTNIIIATSTSLNWVLDTIQSRMHIMQDTRSVWVSKNAFFEHMLRESFKGKPQNLFQYFSGKKYEKEEYLSFLDTLLSLLLENNIYNEMIQKLPQDIQVIKKNNVPARYIVDMYIWDLGNYL